MWHDSNGLVERSTEKAAALGHGYFLESKDSICSSDWTHPALFTLKRSRRNSWENEARSLSRDDAIRPPLRLKRPSQRPLLSIFKQADADAWQLNGMDVITGHAAGSARQRTSVTPSPFQTAAVSPPLGISRQWGLGISRQWGGK